MSQSAEAQGLARGKVAKSNSLSGLDLPATAWPGKAQLRADIAQLEKETILLTHWLIFAYDNPCSHSIPAASPLVQPRRNAAPMLPSTTEPPLP